MQDLIMNVRREVMEVAQKMSRSGLVASVWGNVSGRVPGTDLVAITPSGVEYEELQVESIPVIDLNTERRVEGELKPSSELKMHLAIYRARPDVLGVVHTHSTYASAFSVAHKDIPAVVEDLAQVVGGAVTCAKYALPGTDELGQNAVKALGKKGAALLANHGMVGVGDSVKEALRTCMIVEKGAHLYAIAKTIGNPILLTHEDVEWLRNSYKSSYGQGK
jgi:L-ribulose-5-phosphate 4-epimerase